MDEKKQLKKLWNDHSHYCFILPNLRYKNDTDSFYFESVRGIHFLNDFKTSIELNIIFRNNCFKIILNRNNVFIHNILYHICREERNDGILCIVGIPDYLYLNKMELGILGKCIEIHILKINNQNIFNIYRMLSNNKIKENHNVNDDLDELFEDINIMNENISNRLNKILSIKMKSILL